MSCYHPLLATQDLEPNENGKHELIFHGKYTPERAAAFDKPLLIPCGKCIGCRLDYSRAWADRMIYELDHTKKGVFITLTYNDKHIPYGMLDNETEMPLSYSLDKSDLQKFFKRMRKMFSGVQLRYFACGEYGSFSNTHRPHYHAIIFGLSLEDLTGLEVVKINKLGQAIYRCNELDRLWSVYHRAKGDEPAWFDSIGFASVTDVTWETCAYVARYVMKKVNKEEEINPWLNAAPEFLLSSRRPGLGAYYLEDHDVSFDHDSDLWKRGRRLSVPKFLLKKMELTDPEGYANMIEKRRQFADDKMMLELWQTDLGYEELNRVKEELTIERTKALRRSC